MRLSLVLLALTACATPTALEARRLLETGKPADALALWNERLRVAPNDGEAQRGRAAVLTVLVNQACHPTLPALREVRRLVALGAPVPDSFGALNKQVEAEVRALVDAPLSLGQPLVARRVLSGFALDDAGLKTLRLELEQAVSRVGARRCAVLGDVARTPHLAAFVARYCQVFNATAPRVGPAPERRAALQLEVGEGLPPALADAARTAFAASPWFDASAAGAIEGRLSGRLDNQFEATPITVTASWTETETYTQTEQQTENYQESYTANEYVNETTTEPYTATVQRPVTVSYTDSESYTYSCGSYPNVRTCYGTRPVTRYRTEYRSQTETQYRSVTRPVLRSVMKLRPATRQVSKQETRTRPVARSLQYAAVQKHALHRAQVALALALPGTAKALEFPVTAQADQTDTEHDVTNPPARLLPHRAELTTPEGWTTTVAQNVGAQVTTQLDDAWRAAFCESLDTPEAGARCLGTLSAPAQAWAVVVRFFGEPEAELRALTRTNRLHTGP